MPPSLWKDFKRKEDIPPGILRFYWFDFQGMSDLVCIIYGDVKEVFVYNLSENIWKWFGRRQIEEHLNLERIDMNNPIIFTFQLILYMKVAKSFLCIILYNYFINNFISFKKNLYYFSLSHFHLQMQLITC